jgi:hypothetical protein
VKFYIIIICKRQKKWWKIDYNNKSYFVGDDYAAAGVEALSGC